jgi:hypothetical protein
MPKLPYDTHPSDTKAQAYARGYNRGQASVRNAYDSQMRAAAADVKRAFARAARAEAGAGIGHCRNCALWKRHHDTAKWGRCLAPDHRTAIDAPWIVGTGKDYKNGLVETSETFGCVLWRAALGESAP